MMRCIEGSANIHRKKKAAVLEVKILTSKSGKNTGKLEKKNFKFQNTMKKQISKLVD